ncbi:SDR family oxidoreductase [Haloarcula sp. KBTZ06]|uniref:SDR family oxidoreductase n=1 Tax=unclassified Haloarcula TaxID=2624677 RepID=UPI0005955819|nr:MULTISPECIES: SDR family oxidoreductase [unclassified Haloarcula]AJF25890.1 3-ketoacyl-ACP reductase [Haloarcula sp. CBA1115]KAA9405473.1 SDR family oxidoreductase [Haloarcula sp. CBA1131]
MTTLLEDKTAVVTGGASGFGRAICRRYAEHGADVIIADRQQDPREGGKPTHELVEAETDQTAHFVECDVTNPDDLEVAVTAAEELGGIDIMVNNAGISEIADFYETTEEDYDRLMDVNTKGVFFGAQVATEAMRENGGGTVINMSSSGGIRGTGLLVNYCTSKGAVRLFTYALADRLSNYDIRVNAIHPGYSKTQMFEDERIDDTTKMMLKELIPSGRFGEPEEIADVATFLASDMASYVNGESVVVDGGLTNT